MDITDFEIKNGNRFSSIQISGMNSRNQYVLAVIAKKSYLFNSKGECQVNVHNSNLIEGFQYYPDDPNLMSHDSDLYCIKPFTDVIVQGFARTPNKSRQFISEISLAGKKVKISVVGNRKAYLDKAKVIKFTEPDFVEKIPLRYDFAYGGIDLVAEKKMEIPPENILRTLPPDVDWKEGNPYRYPRNPKGKGYIIELNEEMVDMLELPNLEDPIEKITPSNILVGCPDRWIGMPVPRCTDWVSPIWFPRLAYFGFIHKPIDLNIIPTELKRNWIDKSILEDVLPYERTSMRCANGASLGLQLPHITRPEVINLKNIHPEISNFKLQLPKEIPEIWVDGRKGKLNKTTPVIHTIVIKPDEKSVDIVWSGNAIALRPYLDSELKKMPYKVIW